jgi:hypothetical protein
LKQELENILTDPSIDIASLSRPNFNKILETKFLEKGWESQAPVFEEPGDPSARMDFIKDRLGVEVEFGHPSFLGIDILKFQIPSYSHLDRIDLGVYIVTTRNFQKNMEKRGLKWRGSIDYEKVVRYLPYLKSAIQVPVFVIGIDI